MTPRARITAELLDDMAQDLARNAITFGLTDVEVRNICAQLPMAALIQAADYRAEEKAGALRMAREGRRAAI